MITIIANEFKEPQTSTIWLSNISVVDHAYIDDKGCVRGGSFNPNFIVSGKPDSTEKVVVDFSTVKKDIKTAIDKHEYDLYTNGFDHKLWVIDGYSNITSMTHTDDMVMIETPTMKLEVQRDAIRVIEQTVLGGLAPSHSIKYIAKVFENYVQQALQTKYPDIAVHVTCINNVDEHLVGDVPTRPFHYVHGLKDSTSYGCQNIAHGHRSFIHVDRMDNSVDCFWVLEGIARELDHTVFVRADNIISQTTDTIVIGYTTPKRGLFRMELDTNEHKIVVLPTETTVEFLAAYVKQFYGDVLRDYGANELYISEGLSKGAVETL